MLDPVGWGGIISGRYGGWWMCGILDGWACVTSLSCEGPQYITPPPCSTVSDVLTELHKTLRSHLQHGRHNSAPDPLTFLMKQTMNYVQQTHHALNLHTARLRWNRRPPCDQLCVFIKSTTNCNRPSFVCGFSWWGRILGAACSLLVYPCGWRPPDTWPTFLLFQHLGLSSSPAFNRLHYLLQGHDTICDNRSSWKHHEKRNIHSCSILWLNGFTDDIKDKFTVDVIAFFICFHPLSCFCRPGKQISPCLCPHFLATGI